MVIQFGALTLHAWLDVTVTVMLELLSPVGFHVLRDKVKVPNWPACRTVMFRVMLPALTVRVPVLSVNPQFLPTLKVNVRFPVRWPWFS